MRTVHELREALAALPGHLPVAVEWDGEISGDWVLLRYQTEVAIAWRPGMCGAAERQRERHPLLGELPESEPADVVTVKQSEEAPPQ